MKIVVNYPYECAPITNGYYIERACKNLGFKTYRTTRHPKEVDLVINCDPCSIVRIGDAPSVYWEIDSYRHKGSKGDHYAQADLVFVGTNPKEIERYGYPKDKTFFLPVAADPELHKAQPSKQPFDLAFVGRLDGGYGGRREVLERLQEHFSVSISQTPPGKPYSKAMSQGKLIFNMNTGEDEINSRFFEGMAIGVLITNHVPEMDLLATPYEHFIPYTDDLEKQIRYYLKNPEARKRIAKNARRLVEDQHTFEHRVQTILRYVAMLPYL